MFLTLCFWLLHIIYAQAHNLESFASESASFDLSNTDIAGCMSEIHKATNIVQSMPDLEYNVKEENLALLLRAFESLENYILLLPNQTAYSGEFMMEIFHKGAGISHENHLLFIEELRKVNDMIMDMRGTGATRGSPRLEHFVTCLKRVYGHKLEARCLAKASSYRVVSKDFLCEACFEDAKALFLIFWGCYLQHVSPKTTDEKKNTGRTVSYWCFAPSLAMEELANLNVRSILVTSGTLSPLPSYSMELGLPFAHTLENPHIVKASQVHVRVIGKGVSGKALSSSYERRQDGEYFTELGSTLASLAKVIPAGMLIFFPSYGVMETCIERWGGPSLSRPNKPQGRNAFFAERKKSNATKQYAFPRVVPTYNTDAFGGPNSPWKRLLAAKAIVVEPRSSADLQDAISEFKRFLEMPKSSGCVLMGVCRGKISEGIDFAHDMSRAVIITGIPFPPSFDPKVKMKREYLDYARASAARKPAENAGFSGGQSAMASPAKLSGHEWYTQQAHRAVNQAIGRVIRNMSDYGAVLLLDSRFDQPRNKEGLSRWVRPHVLSDEGFGPAVKALGAFYKEASAEAKVRAESKPLPVEVSYEDERMSDDDSLGEMKSVAVISRGKSNSGYQDSADAQYEDAYVAPDRVTHVEVAGMAKNETSETPKNVQKPFGAQNFDAVFAPRKDNTAPKHSDSTRPAAKIFMEKTLTLMNKKDQSTIRKLIVMTKRHSDSQDVKGFRKSASAIIDMILKAEKHESPPIPDDERMLFLFLELLPSAYRNEFELIALQKLIEISQLGLHCKENLSSADCSRVASAAVAALHLLWFKDDVSDSSFIQHAQVVVSVACKAERLASHTMLRSFLRLLPKDRHEITRRMFDEIESAKRIEQKKQQQKNKVGESAIDMNRFLPANTVNKRAFARHLGENTEAPQAEDTADLKPASQKAAPSQPVSVAAQGQKKAPFNPYKRPDPFNPYKRPKTKPVDSSGPSSSRPTSTKSTPTSISALLKSVESDPYVRQNKASPGAGLKSNAPAGLTCPVCSIQMTKPYLAQCGHMACLACWRDWLKRSETCPTCRTRTNLKSISQAVFKEENSEAAEGSDVQEDHTNAGEEDDGELVFY